MCQSKAMAASREDSSYAFSPEPPDLSCVQQRLVRRRPDRAWDLQYCSDATRARARADHRNNVKTLAESAGDHWTSKPNAAGRAKVPFSATDMRRLISVLGASKSRRYNG